MQDGSVEYCCTGFGGRFFLVLHIEGLELLFFFITLKPRVE